MRGKCCGPWPRRKKPVGARDGRWFTVRIMPYRTLDDRIDGVVITFANITVSKTLETKFARGSMPALKNTSPKQSRKTGTETEKNEAMTMARHEKKNRTPRLPQSKLRRHAEAQLRDRRGGRQPGGAVPKSEDNAQRLFHELQVHQIELEMQNSELRQARDNLEVALEEYTDLYDFAPVGYFTLTADGHHPVFKPHRRRLGRD
ncbi:MAG: PAS domain-containing protein [Limisphaerales bacterium]